jgi:predicted ATP-grasp superfamily ATP-dependent carboligase
MNLLITNSHEPQAYVIACSLRAEADRIIITEGGESVVWTGFRGLLPYSRFVDARHQVPYFAGDWLAGRLQDENTEAEEAYIQRVEHICAVEQVDTIFPSLDPEVYLFAKNKQRLLGKGILSVVPEPEVLRVPMDKALTIQAAQRVGFPCPKTFFPVCHRDIDCIIESSTPPWIVKPRFTAHGSGMVYVAEPTELRQACAPEKDSQQQWPIVQEYLPGGSLRRYYVMVGRDSEILSVMSPDSTRAFRRGYKVSNRTAISASTGPCLTELRALIRELRFWGAYTVQITVDPRDGLPKLLEINARFGHNLWRRTALGVNEPLIFLQLAQDKPVTGNVSFPDGVMLLDPIADLKYLCRQVVETAQGLALFDRGDARRSDFTEVNPRGVLKTLRVYRHEYLNKKRKVFNPDAGNLFVDPWPCIRSSWYPFSRGISAGLERLRKAVASSAAPA